MFFFLRHGCATASVLELESCNRAWMTIMREGDATLRHGRLKIFLGAAPGVGKTVTMLKEAQQRRREGRDVVVGLIETHGRRSTEELVAELELVPRKKIEYRGHLIAEMDTDKVLARKPDLAIVDELAHSNVAGCRNTKRYLDVLELIDAGIDVYTTLNVQHIDSLGTAAAKITWAPVGETVPDRLLELADEVEVVDLSPSDLVRRIEQGRLGASVHGAPDTRTFFSERKLIALRELALRFAKKRPARRILVPFDGSPSAVRAIQHVVALARAGHQGEIVVLNVQIASADKPFKEVERIGSGILEQANQILTRQAIPHTSHVLTGSPAEAIVDAGRENQADLIVMGSRGVATLASMLLGSVATRVVQQSAVPVTLVK
jgi:K+-sensing histidine kinase KdpD